MSSDRDYLSAVPEPSSQPPLKHREIIKLIFFLSVLAVVCTIVIMSSDLLPSFLLSTLIFFIFSPLVNALERRGFKRIYAITIIFLSCGIATTLVTVLFSPHFNMELSIFRNSSDRYNIYIFEKLKEQENAITRLFPVLANAHISENLLTWLNESISKTVNFIPKIASHLFTALFLVPVMSFFLLKDAHTIRRSLLRMVPNRYFETVYSLVSQIIDQMGGYVAARITEAFIISFVISIAFLIFKVPYAILLGLFAGATNAIPYLGPVLGAVPGIALAVLEPTVPNQLFTTSIVYIVGNVIDMSLLFPVLVARVVDLHPLIVILCVLLGSQWFGILGMIIAVPAASIAKILLKEIYSRIYSMN
ncbi:MAG: AI-2E family transporter [Bacteriovoracia bacterium]